MVHRNERRRLWPTVLLLYICGCNSPDDRLLELSRKSLDRQAAQSEMLAHQGQTINESAQKLVDADAASRREFLAATRELQAEREQLNERSAALDRQRAENARASQREPLIASSIQTGALLVACVLPLALGLALAWRVYCPRDDAEALGDLLVRELAADRPRLLPPAVFDELPAPANGELSPPTDGAVSP